MKALFIMMCMVFGGMISGQAFPQENWISANTFLKQTGTLEKAIIAAFKKGDYVYIEAGEYNIDSSIDVLPGKHLKGMGTTVLNFRSNVYYGIGISNGSSLQNIIIEGNKNISVGVISGNAGNVVINGCTIKNCSGKGSLSAYGIFIKNGNTATVSNNKILNIISTDAKAANRGIAIGNTRGTLKITNNIIETVAGPANADGIGINDNGLNGDDITGSTTLITGNTIKNAYTRGIKIQANGIRCIITNNIITSDRPYADNNYMAAGMGIQSSNNDITNNIIRVKFACHGIAVTQKVQNNTINNNTIVIDSLGENDDRILNLRRKTGIFIDAAANNTIQGNTIVGPTFGIRIVSSSGLPSDNTIIDGNNIKRVRYGISDVTKTPYVNNRVSNNNFSNVDSVAINMSRYMQGNINANKFSNVKRESAQRN